MAERLCIAALVLVVAACLLRFAVDVLLSIVWPLIGIAAAIAVIYVIWRSRAGRNW